MEQIELDTAAQPRRFSLQVIPFPAGRWGFAGSDIPLELSHASRLDGGVSTRRTWASREAALAAALEAGIGDEE